MKSLRRLLGSAALGPGRPGWLPTQVPHRAGSEGGRGRHQSVLPTPIFLAGVISQIVQFGGSVKDSMELARRHDADLTFSRHAHTRLEDLSKVVDRLPDL